MRLVLRLQEGNDFVFVGKQMVHLLDMDAVKAKGIRHTDMPNKAVILELSDKWAL